jgi:glycosyltransferase involved in cell wall biosynthesis
MNVSVIMAVCNQGEYCRQTVAGIHNGAFRDDTKYEVILADDCSTDGCCDDIPDARIIRTSHRSGCSLARHEAACAAVGDVIVISDPHCSFEPLSLDRLAQHALGSYGIVQPSVFEERRGRYLAGGKLQLSERGLRITRPHSPRRHPALFGSIYAMRRDVYERLGTLPCLPGKWGRWEQCTTLMAYRFDIPIRVEMGIRCTHHNYRRKGTYPFETSPSEEGKNSFYVHATLLPDSYTSTWETLLTDYHVRHGGVLADMLAPLESDQCEAFASFVKASSILSEQEFYMKMFRRSDPSKSGLVAKALAKCLKVSSTN